MKLLFDLFPVVLFFAVFKLYDIFVATAVAIVAAIAQIGWLWFRHRQIDKMMWINLAVIVVFGGATLISQDEIFIKWKPTVLYWFIATVLLASNQIFKKNLIQAMLEKHMVLPSPVWSRLNLGWVSFFVVMGCINLYVAFGFSVDTWVTFKLFGATGLMLVFVMMQVIMLGRYLKEPAPVLTENAIAVEHNKQERLASKASEEQ